MLSMFITEEIEALSPDQIAAYVFCDYHHAASTVIVRRESEDADYKNNTEHIAKPSDLRQNQTSNEGYR
jgi:hypothetical protein